MTTCTFLKADQQKLTVNVPDTLQALTLNTWLILLDSGSPTVCQTISILSGVSLDEIYSLQHIADLYTLQPAIEALLANLVRLSAAQPCIAKGSLTFKGVPITLKQGSGPELKHEPVIRKVNETIKAEIKRCQARSGNPAGWRHHIRLSSAHQVTLVACFMLDRLATAQKTAITDIGTALNAIREDVEALPAATAITIISSLVHNYPFMAKTGIWQKLKGILPQNLSLVLKR